MKKKILISIISIFTSIILIAVFAITSLPYLQNPINNEVDGSSNWMENVDDETYISSINVPGAHDAGTKYVQLPYFSRCQSSSISQLLDDGVRYLDIRLYESGTRLKITHGSMNCRNKPVGSTMYLEHVLDACYSFLNDNPTETIIFVCKAEQGEDHNASVESKLQKYIYAEPDKWYAKTTIPQLKDVRGKLVLMRRWTSTINSQIQGIDIKWTEQKGYEDTSLNTVKENKKDYSINVQDRYCYTSKDKWTAFIKGVEALEKDESNIAINFLSTKGTAVVGHPYEYAIKLNKKLINEDLSKYTKLGYVVMDYVTAELAYKIYSTNY